MCYVTKAGPQQPYDVQQRMAYDYKTHGLKYRSTVHTYYAHGIRFTIWKTIGSCYFKEQQKCDFCRAKTSLHVLSGPDEEKSRALKRVPLQK